MMTRIFTCFISFLLCTGLAFGQDSTEVKLKHDTLTVTQQVSAGLRIGLDISRFAYLYFQPYRTDVTLMADARLNKNLYVAGEFGYNRTSHSDSNYTYKGNGAFVALGIDYNVLKKQTSKQRNILYVGARYGVALFNYEIPEYHIYDEYWGNSSGSVPKQSDNAQWIELVVGLKAEVFRNFFLGWSLRQRFLTTRRIPEGDFPPLVIPGFGPGNKKSVFDFNYSISYQIPLYNVKIPVFSAKAKPKKGH
ncbi:DUF6048 family protein [Chitinophaga caeni]|nr:DUF6048 family protein [Chitinophaga caeni]